MKNLEEEIEEIITTYFILEKKWFAMKKCRNILFGEDDSLRLSQYIVQHLKKKGVVKDEKEL